MTRRAPLDSLLRTYRERTGRRIDQIADELRPPVSPQVLRQWETGSQVTPGARLAEFATLYRLTAIERDALYAEHDRLAPDLERELLEHPDRWRELLEQLRRAA